MPPSPEGPEPPDQPRRPARKKPVKPLADTLATALGELLSSPQFQAELKSRETPTEARSRLKIKEAEAALRRLHRTIILVAVVVVVSLCALLCMWIAVRPGYPPEIVKWATSILTAIVSGGLGVMVGGRLFKSD